MSDAGGGCESAITTCCCGLGQIQKTVHSLQDISLKIRDKVFPAYVRTAMLYGFMGRDMG